MAEYLDCFENLGPHNHRPTSPRTPSYNCIAWAAGDDQRWWQPTDPSDLGYYWPQTASKGYDIDSLIAAFEAIGFQKCADASLEPNVEKIALYAATDKTWTHAARQLPSGQWTSKLGKHEDIEHDNPEAVAGEVYGQVHCYMARTTG